jgi:predicted O-methyltransferase YrrM
VTLIAPEWTTDESLEVGGITFNLLVEPGDDTVEDSSSKAFVLVKNRQQVERVIQLMEALEPDRMVEVGSFKGGSAALLAALRPEARITALDISPEPVGALDQSIARKDLGGLIHTHHGVDQSDVRRLAELVEGDHGESPLDYVVDDASHFYRETRATFEVLFPRLRCGGVYVIEGWGWAHFPEPHWQAGGGQFHDRPALTNLAVELMMILGTGSNLISDVRISHHAVEVVRGPADYAPHIKLEEHYSNRGLPFRPLI